MVNIANNSLYHCDMVLSLQVNSRNIKSRRKFKLSSLIWQSQVQVVKKVELFDGTHDPGKSKSDKTKPFVGHNDFTFNFLQESVGLTILR